MNKEEYKRVVKIFNEAADLDGPARRAFLDRACGGDETLRSNVERLLSQDTAPGNGADIERELGVGHKLLKDAAGRNEKEGGAQVSAVPAPPLPEMIGCYVIKDKIAEGGMGAVYLAEQDYPHRPVALKMIRPGVFSRDTLRRFKFEAELLGRLQHPGIARIYEAGEAKTETGNGLPRLLTCSRRCALNSSTAEALT